MRAQHRNPSKNTSRPRSGRSPRLRALTILASVIAAGSVALIAQPFPSAPVMPASYAFSDTDDPDTQVRELLDYVESAGRPRRLVQVALEMHRKVSQYTDIDSSPSRFGKNACGPVAAAAALGGDDWTPLVGEIVRAAGRSYGPYTGIQPTKYLAALQQVFGSENVQSIDRGTLGALYRALDAGNVVIIDIKVHDGRKVPSAQKPNYAHFARVLGIDVDRKEIYIENTLRGGAYWIVPLADFVRTWLLPETSSSIILDPKNAEAVTRWAAVVDKSLVPSADSK